MTAPTLVVGCIQLAASPSLRAAAEVEIDDTRFLVIGGGLRARFRSQEDAAPSVDDRSKDFGVGDVWAYPAGNPTEDLSYRVGADKALNNDIRLLEAKAPYEPTGAFRVRAGRMLLPADRSNLPGPCFNTPYRSPLRVNRYPDTFLGRDSGAAVRGLGDGRADPTRRTPCPGGLANPQPPGPGAAQLPRDHLLRTEGAPGPAPSGNGPRRTERGPWGIFRCFHPTVCPGPMGTPKWHWPPTSCGPGWGRAGCRPTPAAGASSPGTADQTRPEGPIPSSAATRRGSLIVGERRAAPSARTEPSSS